MNAPIPDPPRPRSSTTSELSRTRTVVSARMVSGLSPAFSSRSESTLWRTASLSSCTSAIDEAFRPAYRPVSPRSVLSVSTR